MLPLNLQRTAEGGKKTLTLTSPMNEHRRKKHIKLMAVQKASMVRITMEMNSERTLLHPLFRRCLQALLT